MGAPFGTAKHNVVNFLRNFELKTGGSCYPPHFFVIMLELSFVSCRILVYLGTLIHAE